MKITAEKASNLKTSIIRNLMAIILSSGFLLILIIGILVPSFNWFRYLLIYFGISEILFGIISIIIGRAVSPGYMGQTLERGKFARTIGFISILTGIIFLTILAAAKIIP